MEDLVINILANLSYDLDNAKTDTEAEHLWQQAYSDCLFAVSEYGSAGTEYVQQIFIDLSKNKEP